MAVLRGRRGGVVMDGFHDAAQLAVNIFRRPGQMLGVLRHFQTGRRDAAGVRRLARSVQDLRLDECGNRFRRGRHVRAFRHDFAAMLQQIGGILAVEFVLACARERAVQLVGQLPRTRLREELRAFDLGGDIGKFATGDVLQLHDCFQILLRQSFLNIDRTRAVGQRDDFRAQRDQLLRREGRDVAGTGHRAELAFEIVFLRREHVFREVNRAVASRFRTDERTAVGQGLASQNAAPFVAQTLVLAEQITDFTAADVHVASRNVCVRTDMAEQFRHEALAETHDFAVAAALAGRVGALFRIEVRTAFAAAHRQRRQRVFENLLEAEEFQNGEVDRRIETETAFVRADGRIELDAVAAIDTDDAFVVNPRNAEDDRAFRLDDPFQNGFRLIFGMRVHHGGERGENLFHGLQEFRLVRVLLLHVFQYTVNVFAHLSIVLLLLVYCYRVVEQIL